MKKRSQKNLCAAIGLLASFVLWTFAVSHLDVQTIGPNGSSVGFAALNGFFHKLTGVHMALYTVTDWLGLVPLCFVLGFALLGLVQLIQRRSIVKVDYSILVLVASCRTHDSLPHQKAPTSNQTGWVLFRVRQKF